MTDASLTLTSGTLIHPDRDRCVGRMPGVLCTRTCRDDPVHWGEKVS